jgi:hypothetical protein
MDLPPDATLKTRYLHKAIGEYEYSPAPHYEKATMSPRAVEQGTVDFDYHNEESDVEIAPDGAWVRARVGVPREWLGLD